MRTTAIIATFAAASLSAPLLGAEIDEQAQQTLDSVKAFHAGLDAVSLAYTTRTTMQLGGARQDQDLSVSLDYQAPSRFSMKTTNEQIGEVRVISNESGEHNFMNSSYVGGKVYTSADAPDSLAAIVTDNADVIGMSFGTAGIDALSMVLTFASGDPENEMADALKSATFVGEEDIDGNATSQLALVFESDLGLATQGSPGQKITIPINIWVDKGDSPWIRQASPDLGAMFASMPGGGGLPPGATVLATQTLDRASASPVFTADTFAFEPPADARKVTSLFDAMRDTAQQAQQQSSAGPEQLVGNPAPGFELELLTGGKIDLAQHKGKDIVVLDFWATWCGPCIRAMPTIISTTKKFEDQNVVLYAVNLREDNAKIEQFLEKHSFDTKVLLDRDGSIATAYLARGIPQTVIIDKNGVVQAVHVGMLPNLEQVLTTELEKVAAGENLF